MKYLKIQNNGELDIRLVALMGGTTKQNSKFKIGKFGTGLKYTLAYLYRNNIGFKCFTGTQEVKIHTETETIGETNFEIICINHNRTSITTQMGHEWTAWMIIRELWCNALDEGGSKKEVVNENEIIGDENKTTFYVQLTPEISEVLNNWASYFIHHKEPLFEDENFAIYPGDGKLKLYKQGVLIYQHQHADSVFNYDIKGADINELREFRGIISMSIMEALANPNTETINYFFSNVTEKHYEGSDMDYGWYVTFGKVWREAIGSQKIIYYDSQRYVEQDGVDKEQLMNAISLPKKVYEVLTKTFEGVGALRMVDDKSEFFEATNAETVDKFAEAIDLLKSVDYLINPNLSIVYGIFSDTKKAIGLTRNHKELLVSKICVNLTNEELAREIIYQNEKVNSNADAGTEKYSNHMVTLFTNCLLKNIKITA